MRASAQAKARRKMQTRPNCLRNLINIEYRDTKVEPSLSCSERVKQSEVQESPLYRDKNNLKQALSDFEALSIVVEVLSDFGVVGRRL